MADEGGYDLRWRGHVSQVFENVKKFRSSNAFNDVTLCCDGTLLRANKLILAACSSVFQEIFSNLSDEQARVIVLMDVDLFILKHLLDFVYNGEVSIEANLLDKLMNTAEKLGFRGLRNRSQPTESNSREETSAEPKYHDATVQNPMEQCPSTAVNPQDSSADVVSVAYCLVLLVLVNLFNEYLTC